MEAKQPEHYKLINGKLFEKDGRTIVQCIIEQLKLRPAANQQIQKVNQPVNMESFKLIHCGLDCLAADKSVYTQKDTDRKYIRLGCISGMPIYVDVVNLETPEKTNLKLAN